jgi:Lrp/AsnC family transcriptional regulator for asnA, asnC and gidA
MLLPDSISLDDLDFSIIEFLQKDGRKSFTDIARELDVDLDAVIHKLIQCSEVIWIAERTGVFDLAVDVVCRDMNHLHKFLHECVLNLQGVKDTETTIYLKSHKNAAFPVRELIRNPGA